jgi:hypothetical protein
MNELFRTHCRFKKDVGFTTSSQKNVKEDITWETLCKCGNHTANRDIQKWVSPI